MSMRTHRLISWLQPDEAYTLLAFLDQVRDRLIESYGDEVRAMLREASHSNGGNISKEGLDDDSVF